MNPWLLAELPYLLPTLLGVGAFGLAHALLRPGVLTYDEAISYLVHHRPADPDVAFGAIILDRSGKHVTTVRWLFLDSNKEPLVDPSGQPYGRSRRYFALTQELLDEFEETDLLIVS